jgi:hypothetical protein
MVDCGSLSAALIMLTFIGPDWRSSRRIDRRSGDASALIASRFSPGSKVRNALVDFGMILGPVAKLCSAHSRARGNPDLSSFEPGSPLSRG